MTNTTKKKLTNKKYVKSVRLIKDIILDVLSTSWKDIEDEPLMTLQHASLGLHAEVGASECCYYGSVKKTGENEVYAPPELTTQAEIKKWCEATMADLILRGFGIILTDDNKLIEVDSQRENNAV